MKLIVIVLALAATLVPAHAAERWYLVECDPRLSRCKWVQTGSEGGVFGSQSQCAIAMQWQASGRNNAGVSYTCVTEKPR